MSKPRRNAWACENTGKLNRAYGLCDTCYQRHRYQDDNEYRTKVLTRNAVWRKRHPEEMKVARSVWRNENRNRHVATSIRWNKEHPERRKEISVKHTRKRRSALLGLNEHFTLGEWEHIKMKFDNLCASCAGIGDPLEADHIVPLSGGGWDTIDNIQPLCRSCNAKKWAHMETA